MIRTLLLAAYLLLLLTPTFGVPAAVAPAAELLFPLAGGQGLVASFAEYRPDHFHPGVDFSTGGRNGQPVRAAAAGEIFRLKVEWRGYGRALYLRHRDGRISVYAHLRSFADGTLGLEKRVEAEKRRQGSRYPGDIFLDPPVPVERGMILGSSGESGSGLPHLHFEIRNREGDPTDPHAAGLPLDGASARVVFERFRFQADAEKAWVDGARTREFPLRRGADGIFTAARPAVVSGAFLPEAQIHVEDGSGHRLGLRELRVKADGLTLYHLRLQEFRFTDYPKVGLVLDHARSRMSPPVYSYYLRRLPGNDLGKGAPETPEIPLSPGPHQLEVEATGPAGEAARALLPYRVVPSLRPTWELAPDGAGATLRFGIGRADLDTPAEVSYTRIGSDRSIECRDRRELPDGERCAFAFSSSGADGITARIRAGGDEVGRATLIVPVRRSDTPGLPDVRVEPGRTFVDVRVRTAAGQPPPTRILLFGKGGESGWELVEREPGILSTGIPAPSWAAADGLGVEWNTRPSPLRTRLAFPPVSAGPGVPPSRSDLLGCGIRLGILSDSLYAPSPIHCEQPDGLPREAGLEPVGKAVRLLPEGLPLAEKRLLAFPVPPGEPHPERLGIYRFDSARGGWSFQGAEVESNGVGMHLGRFDTYAMLRDDSPPRLRGIDPSDPGPPASSRPFFRVRVEDVGSGLSYDGVHMILDGIELETEYDPDRGWSTAFPARPLSSGKHWGRAWAVDRAGNRSVHVDFSLTVR